MLKIILVAVALSTLSVVKAHDPLCYGCLKTMPAKDLSETGVDLKLVLKKLAEDNGPKYKLSQVNSGIEQLGYRYKLKVDLDDNGTTKTCDVILMMLRWEDKNYQLTLKCPNEPEIKRAYNIQLYD
uniref:Cystatin domain-containing protein n=1 Tax=Stomoxys calcitrans TaxID=35570 RepID=A0A1I8Q691_STOCA